MQILVAILTIILVLVSLGLIVLVMLQEGDDNGLAGLAGGNYNNGSYASRNAGRTREGQLKLYTRIALIAFMVLALVIGILT
ncbi:MAG: preprotein translocase subunit SecG [Lachnospiraceae bacterium]|nr:preprotein translocase subunit SecG [Lachnospiraceae bacterium]